MKIEVSLDDTVINFEQLSITNFELILKYNLEDASKIELDFSSIKSLMGDKIMLEKAFQDEKLESVNL